MSDRPLLATRASPTSFGLRFGEVRHEGPRADAYLVGVVLVRRWERAHGQQVVVGRDGSGDPELYAAAPPRL